MTTHKIPFEHKGHILDYYHGQPVKAGYSGPCCAHGALFWTQICPESGDREWTCLKSPWDYSMSAHIA